MLTLAAGNGQGMLTRLWHQARLHQMARTRDGRWRCECGVRFH